MRAALLLGMVLVVGGCGGGVRKGGSPHPGEEEEVLTILNEHFKHVEVIEWGPHDLTGRLAAEVEKRRKEGWTDIPGQLASQLQPGTRILRVHFRHVQGTPQTGEALFLFDRSGRHLTVNAPMGLKNHDFYPCLPGLERDWLERRLEMFRRIEKRAGR